MNIVAFQANEIGKLPISKDNTFDFYLIKTEFDKVYKINEKFWLLNGSFRFNNKITSKRNNISLEKYLTKEFDFLIIDLDKIDSKFKYDRILEILEKNNLRLSLWESSSHNKLNNFNMKGIWVVKGNNNLNSRKKALLYLDSLIKDYCDIDKSSIRFTAVQKPTHKLNIIKTYYGDYIPEFYYKEKEIELSSFNMSSNELLNICINEYKKIGYNIKSEKDNIISLEHPKEKTKGGYFIFKEMPYICHHFNKNKTFSIYEQVKNTKEYKEYNQKKLEQELKDRLYKDKRVNFSFNERYITDDIVNNIPDNINNTSIVVKSPMGTGKTKFIEKFKNKVNNILIITNRITLAKEYKEKFPDLKLYNEDLYYKGDSLICQFESLHKYNLRDFDGFIIDEFISLLEHSLNGLGDYNNYNNLKLFYILNKLNKPLLIMDAFLTGIELDFFKRNKVIYFENKYRDDNNIFYYSNTNQFIQQIENKLNNKTGKVTLSTTNKIFGRSIYRILKDKYKIAIITGDTINKDKITKHFPSKNHNEWELLIYTPTITVGVNILNESTDHFHYSDGTGSVINSLQQLKRNRSANNLHILLKNKRFNKIIDYNHLVLDTESKLNKYLSKDSLFVNFDKYANIKLSDFGRFTLKKTYLNNLLNMNSKVSFEYLLTEQFSKKIEEIDIDSKDYDINKIIKQIKEEDRQEFIDTIKEMEQLSNFEFILSLENNFDEIKSKLDKLFKDLNRNEIQLLLNEYSKNKLIFKKINNLILFLGSIEKIKNMISFSLSENISRNIIKDFELILQFKNQFKKNTLKQKYPLKEIKDKRFRQFLNSIGYKRKDNNYQLNEIILKLFHKLKLNF